MKKKIFLYLLSVLTLTITCATLVQCNTSKNVPDSFPGNVIVGTKLPDFSCQTSDGAFITMDAFVQKPSLIIFFQPGCPDCVYQLGQIEAVWTTLTPENKAKFNFLAISGGYADEARTYWKEAGYSFPVSFQEEQELYELFSNKGFPSVYLSNSGGEVRFTYYANNMQPAAFLMRDLAALE